MILTYGDTGRFGQMHWYTVELTSEKTVESTLRRMAAALKSIFLDTPVEIFVPLEFRDLDVFELSTSNFVFARSPNFAALLRLKSITGVVGLVTEGYSNHPSKALKIDDPSVRAMIAQAEQRWIERARGVRTGSFVRILDGERRDWCGTVVTLNDGVACVQVEIKTKLLLVETPVRNLLDLDHVPPAMRVFYYAPIVERLQATGDAWLVEEDVKCREEAALPGDSLDALPARSKGRQQTVTAMVKRMIYTGVVDPFEIGRRVVEALGDGRLKRPRNLGIVHGIIKSRLVEDHFRKIDPEVASYRDVVERYGERFRFPLSALEGV